MPCVVLQRRGPRLRGVAFARPGVLFVVEHGVVIDEFGHGHQPALLAASWPEPSDSWRSVCGTGLVCGRWHVRRWHPSVPAIDGPARSVRGRNPRPGVAVPAPHRRFFARIGGVHHPALVQEGSSRPLVRSRIPALPGRAWTAPPEASRRRRGRPPGHRRRPWEAIGSGGEWRRMETPHPPGEAGRVRTVDVPRVRRVRR